jgi:hypothetical protein
VPQKCVTPRFNLDIALIILSDGCHLKKVARGRLWGRAVGQAAESNAGEFFFGRLQ